MATGTDNPTAQDWIPWPGGESGPGDYDGGRVLLRDGRLGHAGYWNHRDDMPGADIVGYRAMAHDSVAPMSGFIEQEPTEPHAFIQWKGTDVCMDFHCECGVMGHFDGSFAYVVKCGACGQEWEMPVHLVPRKRCDLTFEGFEAKLIEVDDLLSSEEG